MLLRKKSIGIKIMAPMVFVILITGIATIAVIQNTLKNNLTLALKEKGVPVAEFIALSSLEPILVEDMQTLQELLEREKRTINDLSYAFITDRDGNIIVHTFSDGFPLHLLWANKITSNKEKNVKLLETEDGLIYDFAVPIMLDQKMIGTVRVGISQQFLKTAITNITSISIAIIFSILVVGILIAVGLTRRIVKPIKNLQHGTEDIIETGNLEQRIMIETGDEIEQLANSFNEMVAGLKEKEDELKRSEERYRTLFDGVPVGLYRSAPDGRILDSNLAHTEMLGYPDRESLPVNATDLYVDTEDRKRWQDLMERKDIVRDFEVQLRRPDGTIIWVVNHARAVRDADCRVLHLEGSLENITERKRAEEELAKYRDHLEELIEDRTSELVIAKERAESADRLKSAFLAAMSHELRTPLNSIIGFTGIMLKGLVGPLNDEQAKQMGMVQKSARHLLSLITDVLDISKIEAGQIEILAKPFDMRDAIEKVVQTVTPLAQKKELNLVAEVAPKVGQITSDRRRVEQILINLVNNAIKFTPEGGNVTVTADLISDYVFQNVEHSIRNPQSAIRIRVIDTGIGIKPEDMGKLFETFQQIDIGLGRKYEGTGLGLSICKRLVELLGGEIRVESEWGVGSTFTFMLPLDL